MLKKTKGHIIPEKDGVSFFFFFLSLLFVSFVIMSTVAIHQQGAISSSEMDNLCE